jgi:hypothetical protein
VNRSPADALKLKEPWCAVLCLNRIIMDHGSVLYPPAGKTVRNGYSLRCKFIAAQHNLLFRREAPTALAIHIDLLRDRISKRLCMA